MPNPPEKSDLRLENETFGSTLVHGGLSRVYSTWWTSDVREEDNWVQLRNTNRRPHKVPKHTISCNMFTTLYCKSPYLRHIPPGLQNLATYLDAPAIGELMESSIRAQGADGMCWHLLMIKTAFCGGWLGNVIFDANLCSGWRYFF